MVKLSSRLYKDSETLRALALYDEFASQVFTVDKEEVMAQLRGTISRVRNNIEALQTLFGLFSAPAKAQCSPKSSSFLPTPACRMANSNALARFTRISSSLSRNSAHMQGYRQVCARIDPNLPGVPDLPKAARKSESRSTRYFAATSPISLSKATRRRSRKIDAALSEAEIFETLSRLQERAASAAS